MTDTEHDITPDELTEIEERAAIMTEHLDGKYGDTVYKHLIATAVTAQREGRTHALVESVENAG
jgi:hypothetical protein